MAATQTTSTIWKCSFPHCLFVLEYPLLLLLVYFKIILTALHLSVSGVHIWIAGPETSKHSPCGRWENWAPGSWMTGYLVWRLKRFAGTQTYLVLETKQAATSGLESSPHLLACNLIVRYSILFCYKNSLYQTLRFDILEKHRIHTRKSEHIYNNRVILVMVRTN